MSWVVDSWNMTRVEDPDFSLVLPQDERTVGILQRSPWLQPCFVTKDWALRVGSSAIVLSRDGTTIVVDPWLAFDDASRADEQFAARLAALASAGVEASAVDIVVNSHVDGVGANVVPGTGAPTFPNARYYLPAAELEAIRHGKYPYATALAAVESMTAVVNDCEIAPGVGLVALPGHNDGHVGVAIGDAALITGHLFLHPAQVANPRADQGRDAEADLVKTRLGVLEACAAKGTILVGPLFAAPGGGCVERDADGWALALSSA